MTRPASVPLFDISRQHVELDAEIQTALVRVCRSGKFVLGPECRRLSSLDPTDDAVIEAHADAVCLLLFG